MTPDERKAWQDDLRERIAEHDERIEMWTDERDRLYSELHPPTQGPKGCLETAVNDYWKRKLMEDTHLPTHPQTRITLDTTIKGATT